MGPAARVMWIVWGSSAVSRERRRASRYRRTRKTTSGVGTWNTTGEVKPNPVMPAGKFTGTSKCEWFPGGFHVVCHDNGNGPMGAMHGLGIMAYNAEDKVYTYSGVDNSGMSTAAKGNVDGNNWVYTSEDKMGGKI